MKKNILTVMVLALCLVNLVLTALLIFTVLPSTKKTDALISQVASVIELELTGYDEGAYKATDLETYKVDEGMTRNVTAEDGSGHVAVLDYVSLSINKNSEDYKALNKDLLLKAYDAKIMDIVGSVITTYTYEQLINEQDQLKKDILQEIRKFLGSSDFVVEVTLKNLLCQ